MEQQKDQVHLAEGGEHAQSVQTPSRNGISYRETAPGHSIAVVSGGRVVGHINRTRDGFVYAPKGSTLRGATYPTVTACKRSLER